MRFVVAAVWMDSKKRYFRAAVISVIIGEGTKRRLAAVVSPDFKKDKMFIFCFEVSSRYA